MGERGPAEQGGSAGKGISLQAGDPHGLKEKLLQQVHNVYTH